MRAALFRRGKGVAHQRGKGAAHLLNIPVGRTCPNLLIGEPTQRRFQVNAQNLEIHLLVRRQRALIQPLQTA